MPFEKGYKPPIKWEKGKSGNPSGRPKGFRELEELCRENSLEATQKIIELMRGNCETKTRRGLLYNLPVPPAVQLAAAIHILERGFGKTIQPIKHDADVPVTLQKIERVIVQFNGENEPTFSRVIDHEPAPPNGQRTNGHRREYDKGEDR